jgi:hypothetical protein
MTAEFTVLGISRLDDHVFLADAGLGIEIRISTAERAEEVS